MKIDRTASQRMQIISKYLIGNVLDVGCNHRLLKPFCKKYTGIDLDLNCDIRADGMHLPFQNKKFDTVVATEIIEHVPNPLLLLKECSRVSKNRVIVTTPNPFRLDYFLEWALREVDIDSGNHLQKFTKKNMLNLSAKSDMKLKEHKNITLALPTFTRIQSVILSINCRFSSTGLYIFKVL